ncbi:MAG: VCBS repeat-containing protein [bacterium]
MPSRVTRAFAALGVSMLASCHSSPQTPTLFELLPPESTGVTFENRVPEDTAFNILNYLYYYNGGGVAAGDVNGDGLPDLYLTSNAGPNRLYLNKGNYKFEDVTARAGVGGAGGWTTGVTMADVNGDGRLDLYVSGVSYLSKQGHNVLYINNGDGTFSDKTKEYGLATVGFSTQALFFDYDGDGDLDMYQLNQSTHSERTLGQQADRRVRNPRSGDKLFRNDGGHFVDVSAQAGIYGGVEGFGLGIVASDMNRDGCPDLYVANDFQENDFLYINNCDGTFTESIERLTGHTSRFSMGVDAADFNNDLKPDLISLDMLPEREEILKTSASSETFNLFNLRLKAGYHPQYARNALQLNRGGARFSEIGYLAGVSATDWSWAPLFADLDNDGRKDLFITNGVFRRPNDLDYISYVGNEANQASLAQGITQKNLTLLKQMPQIPLAKYAFHNNGDLTFTNVAEAWGLAQRGFSNGAVYVDLNNSGALDLVVNNVNAPASIYRNRAREQNHNHSLTISLRGAGANTFGIGATVIITQGATRQMLEQMPTRGFQSSVDPRLHFGVGASTRIDSLLVIWPDHRFQVLAGVAADSALTLDQRNASGKYTFVPKPMPSPLFTDVSATVGIDYKHAENSFVDFDREPLMPHMLSTEGPALAVGDVDGDGLDDVFLGGAKWQAGRLYLQQRDGRFRASAQPALAADSLSEDVDAAFFDANGDGRPDLLVVSGGNEFWDQAEPLRPRLYINDGHGQLRRDVSALPDIFENGACVVPGDFNGDGHIDLFIGGRVVSRKYGLTPRSYLLENDGKGHFTDVTAAKAPGLAHAGMVTSAAWVESAVKGQLDLIVAGEWMPVKAFRQEAGRFVDRTTEAGFANTNGWWNAITAVSLRGDGHSDLLLGNLGLNSYLRAAKSEPARLYVGDFAHNGALEQILTFYKHGVSYPIAGRDELVRLIPSLRSKYASYKDFGASTIEDIFPAADLAKVTVLEARTFASAFALSSGKGTFDLRALPVEAQFAPIYAALSGDFDGDGHTDVIVGGNFYGVTPVQGRYDASYGLLLRGNGTGALEPVSMDESGLNIEGQVRHMALLRAADGGRLIVVARNDNTVQVLKANRMGGARVAQIPRGHTGG